VLARADARVEQRPQLGPLLLGLPLAEAVAVAEDALLGAGLLLVAPRAADQAVEAVFLDGFQQRHGLVAVARFQRVGQAHVPRAMLSSTWPTTRRSPISATRWSRKAITSGKLWPVSTCSSGKGRRPRSRSGAAGRALEGLLGQAQHHAGVLAAAEQQGRALEAGRHLAQDEDGFFFQRVQVFVVQAGQQV
jgi:hypothetical protein